jgi:PAS domain S-box-containing protein
MNKTLQLQLKRFFGAEEGVPQGLHAFLEIVSQTYDDFDHDLLLMERSLEINSRELNEKAGYLQELKDQLESSNKNLTNILEAVPFGIMVISVKDQSIIMVNRIGLQLSGYDTADQIFGKKCHQVICPAQQGQCPVIDLNKSLDRSERLLLTKDGKKLHILKSVVKATINGQEVLIEGFLDIEDQLQLLTQLRASEKKYRDIFENTVEGIYHTSLEGKVLNVNPAFARMFGYSSPQEMINAVTDIGEQHYVDTAERKRLSAVLLQKGRVRGLEFKMRRKDGSLFWMGISASVVRDPDGKVMYFEGTCVDVTERKHAQERLQAIIQYSPLPIALLDADGRVEIYNQKAVDLFGYTQEDIPSVNEWFVLVHPDEESRKAARDQWAAVLAKAKVSKGEFDPRDITIVSKSGVVKTLEIRGTVLGSGLLFIFTDITERKEKDRALRELKDQLAASNDELKNAFEMIRASEKKYRGIFDNALVGISSTSMDGRILNGNPAFVRMLGYPSLEEMMAAITDYGAQHYVNLVDRKELIQTLLQKGSVQGYELKMKQSNGTVFWTVVNLRLVRDSDGKALCIEGTNVDITERKLAWDRLRTVLDSSPIATVLLDADTRIEYNNRKMTELFGYAADEVKTLGDWGLLAYPDEAYRKVLMGKWREALACAHDGSGEIGPFEENVTCKSGAVLTVEIRGAILGSGILCTFNDITDQKSAHLALESNERFLKSILDADPVGLLWVIDHVIHFINKHVLEITGYMEEELRWMDVSLLYVDGVECQRVRAIFDQEITERTMCRPSRCGNVRMVL